MPDDLTIETMATIQRVPRDIACRHCGYNLRTLPIAGRCPECGATVAETLERESRFPLTQSDPSWLRRVAAGCFAWCFLVTASIAAWIWFAANWQRFLQYRGIYRSLDLPSQVGVGMQASAVVLALYALFEFASHEPAPAPSQTLSNLIRRLVLVLVVGIAAAAALRLLNTAHSSHLESFSAALVVLPFRLLLPLCTALMYVHAARLLWRSQAGRWLAAEALLLCPLCTWASIEPSLPTLSRAWIWMGWCNLAGIGDPFSAFTRHISSWPQSGQVLLTLWGVAFWFRTGCRFRRLAIAQHQ